MTLVPHRSGAAPIRVSAPGKLLLFGEHAVVYGCPTVAAALSDLRVHVTIERIPDTAGAAPVIALDCRDLGDGGGLNRVFTVSALRDVVVKLEDDRFFLPKPSNDLMERIEALLHDEQPDDARALRPAVFLCCSLLRRTAILSGTEGSVRISCARKNLPIGAGLGSSAAFCVAIAGALAQLGDRAMKVEAINAHAFAAEVLLHGSPSGADNTVSAFGGALVFKKLPEPTFRSIRCDLNRFRFLLVNTRVPRSTKALVGKVREQFEADPPAVQTQFDAIEEIVQEFIALSDKDQLTEPVLARQIEANHRALDTLGVSHPQIEKVARICRAHGGTTKLTGAGGGGCTVSLLPGDMTEQAEARLVDELEAEGFECFRSSIGGHGFTVDP